VPEPPAGILLGPARALHDPVERQERMRDQLHPDPLSVISRFQGRDDGVLAPVTGTPASPRPRAHRRRASAPVSVTARPGQPNRQVVSRTGPIVGVDTGPIVTR